MDEKKTSRARALDNDDFICIETFSTYGRSGRDPEGRQHLLVPDASDEALGSALLDALAHSRYLTPEEARTFFNYEAVNERYEQWKKNLMEKYGYKTKRALFKNMKSCSIKCCDGQIKISPTHHEKLEGWGREKDDGIEDVYLSADSSSAEIGGALRLAFSRCT